MCPVTKIMELCHYRNESWEPEFDSQQRRETKCRRVDDKTSGFGGCLQVIFRERKKIFSVRKTL